MADAPTKRQFVNFAFYKIDPKWRLLPEADRARGKAEFIEAVERLRETCLVVSYSLVGIRGDCDFMLWRISYDLEDFQRMTRLINRTALAPYLTTPYSYLAQAKRSQYVDKHVHEGQEGRRARVVPGEYRYIFVYPFVKTREWFLLPMERRQEMMDVHIKIGHEYPSVKLNTTYSFGMDDQEWVVAFETDHPSDFVDLVMALRETEGSRYTLRDTPIFTCVKKPLAEALEDLG
ncbi:MAG TPA: chlorite dismutase family protein [Thermodesulfobacteriota bacterium]